MIPIEFNTKQELYEFLNRFDFDSIKDTKLSDVYFLVEFDGHTEPIHFMSFEDVWFESPCGIHKFIFHDDDLMSYVDELYDEDLCDDCTWDDLYEYEKTMQRNDMHYEIYCPQCVPFLPDKIKILDVFSDSRLIDLLGG